MIAVILRRIPTSPIRSVPSSQAAVGIGVAVTLPSFIRLTLICVPPSNGDVPPSSENNPREKVLLPNVDEVVEGLNVMRKLSKLPNWML